jgi:hypothetical protein
MLKRHHEPAPIPEAASEEPRTVTPDEDADRATRRLERQDSQGETLRPEPDDPGRQPGVLSPPPGNRR